jgi:hypothetical protein
VYQAFDGTVVAVETAVTGSGFTLGAGRTLFRTRNSSAHEYVLWPTPDAQRFLVVEPVEQESPRPFTVVLGWQRALNR